MELRKLLVLVAVAAMPRVASAQMPKDVVRSTDSFTGDTIYVTKYGRLDGPQVCGRSDIALFWKLARGSHGQRESLMYSWDMVAGPLLSKAHWLNATAAVLKLDEQFVELEAAHGTPQIGGGGREFHEKGEFLMPAGTMTKVLAAKDVKVRFVGTGSTCDGTLEPNMTTRLRDLLAYLKD